MIVGEVSGYPRIIVETREMFHDNKTSENQKERQLTITQHQLFITLEKTAYVVKGRLSCIFYTKKFVPRILGLTISLFSSCDTQFLDQSLPYLKY